MPITLSQLKDQLQLILAGLDTATPEDLATKLLEFMKYSLEHYDELDGEAKSYVDSTSERLRSAFQTIVDKLPEGPQKRQMQRQLGLVAGIHFLAGGLIEILESPPMFAHPVLAPARDMVVRLLQNTLDVLFDATRHSHEGAATFAKIGLCFWVIDELLAAIHLAQRAFANQSYAHIRTAYEILDLVELFDNQPEWAKLWISGNDGEVWSEFRPAAVRKKLGEPKFDPMYSFFSELGSHGTFRGLQARGGRIVKGKEEDIKHFKIFVGGSQQVHHIVWTNSLCVYTSLSLLVKCARVFAAYLNAEEMKEVLQSSSSMTANFFIEHFVQWAKDEGLEYKPALEFLSKAPWLPENG
jgi:hypothetical protein